MSHGAGRRGDLLCEAGRLIIPQDLLNEIIAHAREAFPEECCGLLVGLREPASGGVVKSVHRMTNLNRARAGDRYEIDPLEFHRVDKTLWGKEEEIIGLYHSHPNHPPLPSGFDAERAWPSYCYLIVAIDADGNVEPRAWRRRASPEGWEEEAVETE